MQLFGSFAISAHALPTRPDKLAHQSSVDGHFLLAGGPPGRCANGTSPVPQLPEPVTDQLTMPLGFVSERTRPKPAAYRSHPYHKHIDIDGQTFIDYSNSTHTSTTAASAFYMHTLHSNSTR